MRSTSALSPSPAPGTRALGLVRLRELGPRDLTQVQMLLKELPRDYPKANEWLTRRLGEVLEGGAHCTVADLGGRLAGVTIFTRKSHATKLNTIFVAEALRGFGLGSALLDDVIVQALSGGATDDEIGEIYVTVAYHKWSLLAPLLASRGFVAAATELNRYGPGRHEVIATHLGR